MVGYFFQLRQNALAHLLSLLIAGQICSVPCFAQDPNLSLGWAYNRWDQSGGDHIVLSDGSMFSADELKGFLSQSPSEEARALLSSHETWQTISTVSLITLAATLTTIGVGYIKSNDNQTNLSIGLINGLWIFSGVAIGASVFSWNRQNQLLHDAVSAHNRKVRVQSVQVSWRMEW